MMKQIDYKVLYPGWTYREMAVRAGDAYWEIQYLHLKLKDWPFDDPDPFVGS